ncbi:pilus assembly protein [Providencia rettgeri]|uniref:pilus assembly protein n=1 Tax=Providencia rettgeri TaxID=587 RepID=UPI0034E0B167
MKANKISSVLALTLIATSLFSANIQAKENTINFKAAIVIPPCSYDVNENGVDLTFYNDNTKKMSSISINVDKEKKSAEWKVLESNRSIYQLNWTDKEKGFAMLSVQQA